MALSLSVGFAATSPGRERLRCVPIRYPVEKYKYFYPHSYVKILQAKRKSSNQKPFPEGRVARVARRDERYLFSPSVILLPLQAPFLLTKQKITARSNEHSVILVRETGLGLARPTRRGLPRLLTVHRTVNSLPLPLQAPFLLTKQKITAHSDEYSVILVRETGLEPVR